MDVTALLSDVAGPRPWKLPDGSFAGFEPRYFYLGPGKHALEVAVATVRDRPAATQVRELWKARQGRTASPLLLAILHEGPDRVRAWLCGPVGEDPPVYPDLDPSQAQRIARAALQEPDRHAAIRFLVSVLPETETDLPGLRNVGMFATHELKTDVPHRPDWASMTARGRTLLDKQGRQLVEGLGFEIEARGHATSVLRVRDGGVATAIAIFLERNESPEATSARFPEASPVSTALAQADRENLPYVVLTRGRQIRIYGAGEIGVGRKGRAETFIEADLALLPEQLAGYLPLLFGADALRPLGTFEEILERSRDFATDLGGRLRDRIYNEVVPALAGVIARYHQEKVGGTATESELRELYETTMTVLFRLLFVAYAEDKGLLPYDSRETYRSHALKTKARELARRANESDLAFDAEASDLWTEIQALWTAIDGGHREWGVPAYDGGLFSSDPETSPSGARIAAMRLTNAEIGPALRSLLVDRGDNGVHGPVDFRALSVREFGTIYEGLLDSSLAVAPADLAVDAENRYVPATKRDRVVVPEGEIYLQNRSGARKATGTYFTKPFAVEHLLGHALEPALGEHLTRLERLLEQGDEAGAAAAFFDFRIADIAMGSGHFLVAAVDRIERRFSDFLEQHPIPNVVADLERLKAAALMVLGELSEGVEIERATLLRRQIARRCIYGVDLNEVAVELARLALWIHTFVPGLPLSFLNHNLVCGNSLTGIGTLDEAMQDLVADWVPGMGDSLFLNQIVAWLSPAEGALRRLARAEEATAAEVHHAEEAHREARRSVEPAEYLFDLLLAVRLGEAPAFAEVSDKTVRGHPKLKRARELADELEALHFPIAFPEVFLRDRPGFDVILGNPPWEKTQVEEHEFWSRHMPGLLAVSQSEREQMYRRLRRERPDLVALLQSETKVQEKLRGALMSGHFPGMGAGHPDLYKAFCWRFWNLVCQEGGRIAVVLPRSALAAKGSTEFRQEIFRRAERVDITMLLNNKHWFFEDVHPQYTIGLVAVTRREVKRTPVALRGPYSSFDRYKAGVVRDPAVFYGEDIQSWNDTASLPLLPTDESVEVFAQLRKSPRIDLNDGKSWRARPLQGDLNSTTGKPLLDLKSEECPRGFWPVFKGESFDLWNPDTGTYYAWADPKKVLPHLQEKRVRGGRNKSSPFSEFAPKWLWDIKSLACLRPRISFRRISRATDTRTIRVALVPPEVFVTDVAPYFLWPRGSASDEAYLLGVMASLILDWYARRFVETHMDFHVVAPLPVPRPPAEHPLRRRVVELAGRLACPDRRFVAWAKEVGVTCGPLSPEEKEEMIDESDAVVAHLYELSERHLVHIFETFHEGWDYRERLARVMDHFKRIGKAR